MMKRLCSKKDLKGYTKMLSVLINLELEDKDYYWLISDIEAYPTKEKYINLINNNKFLLLKTEELVNMLQEDDFQWIWAVFSAIPLSYSKEQILKYDLPVLQSYTKDYNPFLGKPKLQHPFAEFEIYAWDSSGMFIVSDDGHEILKKFRDSYPLSIDDFDRKIVFDDWRYRNEMGLNYRKKDYKLSLVIMTVFSVITIIGMFISLYAIFFFILALLADTAVMLDYLKFKNHHLIITTEAIYITNLFKKEKEYIINYKNLLLEIKKSAKRGGGLWLKFYKDGKLLFKYEDMLNFPISCGDKLTDLGIAIKSLNIPVKDRNGFYDQW